MRCCPLSLQVVSRDGSDLNYTTARNGRSPFVPLGVNDCGRTTPSTVGVSRTNIVAIGRTKYVHGSTLWPGLRRTTQGTSGCVLTDCLRPIYVHVHVAGLTDCLTCDGTRGGAARRQWSVMAGTGISTTPRSTPQRCICPAVTSRRWTATRSTFTGELVPPFNSLPQSPSSCITVC